MEALSDRDHYVIYEPSLEAQSAEIVANRHGIYRPLVFERDGGEAKVQLRFVTASELKQQGIADPRRRPSDDA